MSTWAPRTLSQAKIKRIVKILRSLADGRAFLMSILTVEGWKVIYLMSTATVDLPVVLWITKKRIIFDLPAVLPFKDLGNYN
jgi:hypothetical protein